MHDNQFADERTAFDAVVDFKRSSLRSTVAHMEGVVDILHILDVALYYQNLICYDDEMLEKRSLRVSRYWSHFRPSFL